ncbi:MAG: hypothetical protein ACJ75H_07925 [Thermoanaerobaculia bacterium]
MSATTDTVTGLRCLLEDLLAPRVSRLDAKVEFLNERVERLAVEVQENRSAHQALLTRVGEELSDLHGRIGRLEGRSEGLKTELTAVLQMEILRMAQKAQTFTRLRPEGLLPAGDPEP